MRYFRYETPKSEYFFDFNVKICLIGHNFQRIGSFFASFFVGTQKENRLPLNSGNRYQIPVNHENYFLFSIVATFIAAFVAVAAFVSAFLGHHRLTRKLDLVAFFADTLNEYLLAFLELVTHVLNAAI